MKTTASKIWRVLILMTMLGFTACGSGPMDLTGANLLQGPPQDTSFTEDQSVPDELDPAANEAPPSTSFQQNDEPVSIPVTVAKFTPAPDLGDMIDVIKNEEGRFAIQAAMQKASEPKKPGHIHAVDVATQEETTSEVDENGDFELPLPNGFGSPGSQVFVVTQITSDNKISRGRLEIFEDNSYEWTPLPIKAFTSAKLPHTKSAAFNSSFE